MNECSARNIGKNGQDRQADIDRSNRMAKNAVAMPIGTLTRKIQCQLRAWVKRPPASRPIDAPPAATKLYMPIARARSRGSLSTHYCLQGNDAEMRAAVRLSR